MGVGQLWLCPLASMPLGSAHTSGWAAAYSALPTPLPETPNLWPVTQLGFLRFGECDCGVRVGAGVGLRPVLCVGL